MSVVLVSQLRSLVERVVLRDGLLLLHSRYCCELERIVHKPKRSFFQ